MNETKNNQISDDNKSKTDRYNSIFARNLRELLAEKKVTHETVANAIGVTRQAVGKWANGETVPDVLKAGELAKFFDTSVDYMIGLSKVKRIEMDEKVKIVGDFLDLSDKSIDNIMFCKKIFEKRDFGNVALNHFLEGQYFKEFSYTLLILYITYELSKNSVEAGEHFSRGILGTPIDLLEERFNECGYPSILDRQDMFDLYLSRAMFSLKDSFQDWGDIVKRQYTLDI